MEIQYDYLPQHVSKLAKTLDENSLLKTEELAELLNVSPKTIRRWRYACDLGGIKIGSRLVRYRWSDVVKWLQKREA